MTVKEYLKQHLEGKYINGFKIIEVEQDPFIKGQLNLFTDEMRDIGFGDKAVTKFYISDKPAGAKIYKEKRMLSIEDRIKNYRTTLLNRKCDDPNPFYNNVKEVDYGVAVIDNILNMFAEDRDYYG